MRAAHGFLGLLHLHHGIILPDLTTPASHQFWGQQGTARERALGYFYALT